MKMAARRLRAMLMGKPTPSPPAGRGAPPDNDAARKIHLCKEEAAIATPLPNANLCVPLLERELSFLPLSLLLGGLLLSFLLSHGRNMVLYPQTMVSLKGSPSLCSAPS